MAGRCFIPSHICMFGKLLKRPVLRQSIQPCLCNKKAHTQRFSYHQKNRRTITFTHHFASAAKVSIGQKNQAGSGLVNKNLTKELRKAARVVEYDTLPAEESIQEALQVCETLAKTLMEPTGYPKKPSKHEQSPTSSLLSLESESSRARDSPPLKSHTKISAQAIIADRISLTAYKIITDPKVFISQSMLAVYVSTQTILSRPQSFPEVFDLYASKPKPRPGTNPISYEVPNPNHASSAVPLSIANRALTAAIEMKNLSICLSIIDSTASTIAYKRNKLVRKALFPATGLALVPAAAYALSAQLAQMQQKMDQQTATWMLFVGIFAYVGFTSMIGLIAVATSNDQMDRITWAKGTPLSQRWLREDERALVDRVAGAWGFQDTWLRGEEDGLEWETLREWAGRRSMVLDNPELMEGME
ncbi:hypothetical protein ACLMJK_004161 [Lecanora helva]